MQPETVYKADVTPITGDLLDYLVSVDDLTLTLSLQIPTSLLPAVGDKIVSVDLKEPFPYGFLGRVVSVNQTGGGYVVKCEFIGLEEAVDRLCVTTTTATTDAGQMLKRLAPRHVVRDYTFDIGEQQQSFDLSSVINKKDVLSVTGKAAVTATVHPVVYVQATYVVNPQVGLYTKFLIVGDTSASLDLDVAGEVSRELWKKALFSKEKPLAYGFTLYAELGAKVEASGEMAVGVTFSASGRQTLDIVYCPFRPEHNDVAFNNELLSAGADWHYLAARASLKACGYLELGVGYAHHYLAKVGGEFELGAKGEYESVLDLDLLERADEETAFYEAMNDQDKVDVNAYVGAYFVAALLSEVDNERFERLKFRKGRDVNLTPEPIFQGRSLPLFVDIETPVSSSTSATAATQLSGDLLLPQTVGLRIVDEDDTTVDTYRRDATYWNRLLSDRELEHEFSNLQKGKKYTIYPIVNWFGHDIIATPSAELDMNFPVELSDFKVTKRQFKDIGEAVAFIGFPETSLPKWTPEGAEQRVVAEKHMEMLLPETMLADDVETMAASFAEWKEALPMSEPASASKKTQGRAATETPFGDSPPATSLTAIMQRVLAWPLESKSPIETITFMADIKQRLASLV